MQLPRENAVYASQPSEDGSAPIQCVVDTTVESWRGEGKFTEWDVVTEEEEVEQVSPSGPEGSSGEVTWEEAQRITESVVI